MQVHFLDSLKFFLSLYGHKLPVLSMDISSDSSLLISGAADKNLKIWGLDFGDCHRSLFAHADSIMQARSPSWQPHPVQKLPLLSVVTSAHINPAHHLEYRDVGPDIMVVAIMSCLQHSITQARPGHDQFSHPPKRVSIGLQLSSVGMLDFIGSLLRGRQLFPLLLYLGENTVCKVSVSNGH